MLDQHPHSTIPEALKALAEGRVVVVSDGEERENEADLIMAASLADPRRSAS